MMHDNLDPTPAPERQTPAARQDEAAADREVPLDLAQTPAVIHAWLDGDAVDPQALKAASGYQLWSEVKAETDRRRRMRTPTPVAGAILAAIRKDA